MVMKIWQETMAAAVKEKGRGGGGDKYTQRGRERETVGENFNLGREKRRVSLSGEEEREEGVND